MLDQLQLQLADLEEDAAQAEAAAGMAPASHKIAVLPVERRKPARRPLPEHLPRERTSGGAQVAVESKNSLVNFCLVCEPALTSNPERRDNRQSSGTE